MVGVQSRWATVRIPGGILHKVKGVPNVLSANRLMEKVRTYRT